eukprot:3970898-Amphidinium_carterae.2
MTRDNSNLNATQELGSVDGVPGVVSGPFSCPSKPTLQVHKPFMHKPLPEQSFMHNTSPSSLPTLAGAQVPTYSNT